MAWLSEILVSALILIGALFLFVGSFGLVKLPDIMRRLHAPTKSTTLGIGALLIASMLYFALLQDAPSLHELVITVFLFLTAPITAHMISKAHILRNIALQQSLPAPPGEEGWATLDRVGPDDDPPPGAGAGAGAPK
ncbi:Na+/H+ antiporter subunit G [Rhodopseudomonas pseudopalustris]|uniref:Multisubunit potassium/proton antiporter, PhaG subunit n=1 Tax=Rhodopseudomonas pseudopalustris TaxID=1513892 RepID=A0A1H8U746_9BRAD|nr:Na+/H+ antiporter subunit G [Rhodopseudomonas pseudopalustris]MBB1089893.1 Na+/H+ antiporter subunit G [Rhodopseudomonas palustris]SEO99029.1 multisubunit potassium/proton antiporter, PhaG subunit [Rhodopseudomonas pseudopalustris]